MGVQIWIKKADMESAGWQHHVKTMVEQYENEYGTPVFDVISTFSFEKDGEVVFSYAPDDFVWDCNHWGPNRARFINLGLFMLPYEFF